MAIGNSDGSIILETKVDEGGLDKFKSGIGVVGKALGVALATGASGFSAITTGATKSYAEYEQLVGGVETLFGAGGKNLEEYAQSQGKTINEIKDEYDELMISQQNVFDDARQAYITAGLSANEYMETVTGFSASLLQSLGGDTVKAAELGNQTVVDMSDNANKMGTSMESIQNAYQGFAKQNYTMLDNLKLGYGGTKEEMERLLTDAENIQAANGEMADYSIDSFADIVEAIHVVQDNMGITGTTADEAATTVQGSANMMKSSWQNMLTGFADPSQNMGTLLENFVSSISTFATNFLPVVENSANSIIQVLPSVLDQAVALINEMLPSVITAVMGIISGIVEVLPELLTALVEFLPQIVSEILNLLPDIIQAGLEIILALAQGIAESLPDLIPTIVDVVLQICQTLIDNLDQLLFAAVDIIVALATGLIDAIPNLLERLPEIIISLVMALTNPSMTFKLVEAAILLMAALVEGIIKSIPAILIGIAKVIPAMIDGFKSSFENFKQIGKHLIDGLWQGILNTKDWLLNKIKSFAKTITDGIKDFFGIHSPSKVFRDEIGKNLMLGMAEGITGNEKTVLSAMTRVSKGLADTTFSMPRIVTGGVVPYFVNAIGASDSPVATNETQEKQSNYIIKEEHYNLNQTELMTIIYKLVKGGERLNGTSLLNGGVY